MVQMTRTPTQAAPSSHTAAPSHATAPPYPARPNPPFGWRLPLARGASLAIDRPLVMAIVNATPDSFSDGGELDHVAQLGPARLDGHIRAIIDAGADILDVGGESTRPGHAKVPADEELRRVLPVIEAIRRVAPQVPVSIDTSKAEVARQAIAAGASFVNDVSALGDPGMAEVVRNAGCAVVLMRHAPLDAAAIASSCARELEGLRAEALAAGLREQQLVLDPGIGFGDPPGGDVVANLTLLTAGARHASGRPVLVGASRKRFLGTMTGETLAARRVGASVAAAVLAVQSGAAIVRVHDVRETAQALRVLQAAQTLG
jgi:dihydropteroate synthase